MSAEPFGWPQVSLYLFILVALGIKPRASHMPGKNANTELPRPPASPGLILDVQSVSLDEKIVTVHITVSSGIIMPS